MYECWRAWRTWVADQASSVGGTVLVPMSEAERGRCRCSHGDPRRVVDETGGGSRPLTDRGQRGRSTLVCPAFWSASPGPDGARGRRSTSGYPPDDDGQLRYALAWTARHCSQSDITVQVTIFRIGAPIHINHYLTLFARIA